MLKIKKSDEINKYGMNKKKNYSKFQFKNSLLKPIIKLLISLIFILTIIPNQIYSSDNNEDNIYSYDYLKLEIKNNIEFQIDFEPKYSVKNFNLYSFFFPQNINNTQYLNSFKTSYENYQLNYADEFKEIPYLNYEYDKSSLKEDNIIQEEYIIESIKYHPKIKEKIKYPIKNLNSKYDEYLKFYDLINIDNDIRNQAIQLAEGEDDLFIIASKIAKWIQNDINYDLKTALQNPNQKSTDVFKSKSGVCKEITNLYISMLRSIGIPSRVVSGYAYTNSNELISYLNSNWGGHAWAEVLIGDTWVPFDLTYNEYGYIDPSHIIIQKSAKSKTQNVLINGSGYGFKIRDNSLKTNVEINIIKKDNFRISKPINLKLSGPTELGFSSYGFIKVDIENNKDYYQILFIRLIKTPEVEMISDQTKMIILKPNEKTTTYFNYKLPDNLDKDYIYTFPFSIQNEYLNETLNVKSKYDFNKIKKIALPKEEIETNSYSSNKLITNCQYQILDNYNKIICSIKNPNNYNINNINICLEPNLKINKSNPNSTNCIKLNLDLGQEKTIEFKTKEFKQNISYTYSHICGSNSCIENEITNLEIETPKLNYSFNKITKEIKFKINNFQNSTSVNLYINNKLINTFNSETGSYSLNEFKKNQNYSIKLELKLKNQIIEIKEIKIHLKEINLKEMNNQNNSKNENSNINNINTNNEINNDGPKIIQILNNIVNSIIKLISSLKPN